MIRKFILFVIAIIVVGCSSNQSVVRTTRPVYKRPATAVTRTVKKPVYKKPGTEVTVTHNPEVKKIEQKYEAAKVEGKSDTKESVYSKTEILEATTRVKVTTAMVLDYISLYKDIAKNNMVQYGIPASIIIGQGILESGAGTGPLSAIANNHFGIKCHEWTGPSVKYDDDAAQECFRKYAQASESYMDHAIFLTGRKWYQPLFLLAKDDYKGWANGLKKAGYATDPKYPAKLIAIIERYQLNKYDSEVLGTEYVAPVTCAVPVNPNIPKSVNSAVDIKVPIAIDSTSYQVCQGDTLYSISKRFNITIDDLKVKNEILDNTISIGQNLIIK